MQIVIHGSGKMAAVLESLIANTDDQVVSVIDPRFKRLCDIADDYDLVIDFSHPAAISNLLTDLEAKPKPILIATTGLEQEQLSRIRSLSKRCPVFQDYNTSQGIAVLCKLVSEANKLLGTEFDRTLLDRHHRNKVDSPSGTAYKLANMIDGELAISSVRAGGIFGQHTIAFTSQSEEITISHTAFNREVFANGAIKISHLLIKLDLGLYNIETIYGGE